MVARIAAVLAIATLTGCGPGGPVKRLQAPTVPVGVESFSDCTDCPTMIVIPARQGVAVGGTSEEREALKDFPYPSPRVAVNVHRFALGQTEITIGQFKTFMSVTGYKPKPNCGRLVHRLMDGFEMDADLEHPGFPVDGNYPAGCMRLEDAEAYTAWLSVRTGQHYRLPTEAEWEYVARGGTSSHSYLGGNDLDPPSICRFENVGDANINLFQGRNFACTDRFDEATSPVGYFEPNTFGVYDMLGNVMEWIAGCSRKDVISQIGESVPREACAYWITKGGSYLHGQESGLAAFKFYWPEQVSIRNDVGFRVARELE